MSNYSTYTEQSIKGRKQSPCCARCRRHSHKVHIPGPAQPITRKFNTPNHDDLLFVSIPLTGFHALLHFGELVWPDCVELQTVHKLSMHTSTKVDNNAYKYSLPAHKADPFFEGNHVS